MFTHGHTESHISRNVQVSASCPGLLCSGHI